MILRIKDGQGNWISVPAIKGEPGDVTPEYRQMYEAVTQAMTDFLNMLGTDVATLTNGKLTPSQIPDISINDVFEVDDTEEMLTLTAQKGDCALIMGVDEEDNPIVTDSYLLAANDATVLANWKKLGVSYVANAGHALTADNATNATKINGHGLVRFDTLAELEAAVKIEGTLYYAPYDEE
jgi:hypothetical protein